MDDIGKRITVFEKQDQKKELYKGRIVEFIKDDGFVIMKDDGVFKVVYPTLCKVEIEKLKYEET